ncbi:T1SS-143 repeat domain-containing protein [Erythrobacter mangrovi]|uniref:DUF5801 domain-containing protein n=1 Tax=Erythrobacter mangrovi TaxID=2739433 RepID=A0A7D4CE42_9SPHN|nr:DUF5801 repeats-in-toxin domain-containing protein [Erythrobacter mangrovi]QKG72229.1 hypothetical protein HQR01_13110 [Erythrobacter mangrovi]
MFETAASTQTYLTGLGLTSGGVDLFYLVTSDGILAKAGPTGDPVFVVILESDGDWEFQLLGPLDHSDPATEDDITIEFGSLVVATDADGDSVTATGSLAVTVDDDSPVAVAPVAVEVINGASDPTSPIALDIDGTLANNYGGDGAGTVRFLPTLDGMNSGLFSSFQAITYVLDDDQTLRGVAGGETIFTVTLDPATGTYVVDMDGSIDSTQNIEFNPLVSQFVGGNGSWTGFVPIGDSVTSPIDDNSLDLLLTPEINGANGGTINSTANIGGVSQGASVGSGETFRVDFVIDLSGDPADSTQNDYAALANRDHMFDGHYTVNGAQALFKSTTGSTVRFTAFDDPDGNTVVGDGMIDTITGVAITWRGTEWVGGGGETLIIPTSTRTEYTINGHSFWVTLEPSGSVLIEGLEGDPGSSLVGTQVAIFTADGFNSIEYTWVDPRPGDNLNQDTFQIGGFGATTLTTDPVEFSLPVQVVDGDGDISDTGNITITAVTPSEMMATAASEDLSLASFSATFDSSTLQGTELFNTSPSRQTDVRSMGLMSMTAAASGLSYQSMPAPDQTWQFANTDAAGTQFHSWANSGAFSGVVQGANHVNFAQIDGSDTLGSFGGIEAGPRMAMNFDSPLQQGLAQIEDVDRGFAGMEQAHGFEALSDLGLAQALPMADAMAGMEQLLLLANGGVGNGQVNQEVAAEALAQLAQDVGIDNLIDHFASAAGEAPALGAMHSAGVEQLSAFLDLQVGPQHAGGLAVDILHDAAAMADAVSHA